MFMLMIGAQLMKQRMSLWQISFFWLFFICIDNATALDASDATTRLDNLVRRSLLLQQNILNVQKSTSPQVDKAWECLNELYYRLEVISVRIDGLYSIVALTSSMRDKSDEQTVLDMLNEEATTFLDHVQISRRGINLTAGYCSSINVAVAKAQEILEFYGEATSVVRSITKAR
jgi:hypothetical protein